MQLVALSPMFPSPGAHILHKFLQTATNGIGGKSVAY